MRFVTVITVRSFVDSFAIVFVGLAAFSSYAAGRYDIAITSTLLYAAYNVVLRITAASYYRYDDLHKEVSEEWLRALGFVDEDGTLGVLRFYSLRTWVAEDGRRIWLIDSAYSPEVGTVVTALVPHIIAPRSRAEALELFGRLHLPIPRIKQVSTSEAA